MNDDITFELQGLTFLIVRPKGNTTNEKFAFGLGNIDSRVLKVPWDLILIDVGTNTNMILLAVDWDNRGGWSTQVFTDHLQELGVMAHKMTHQFIHPGTGIFYGSRDVISIIDPESVMLCKLSF